VLIRNGFILGCDDQHFYEGRYVLDDDRGFRALVKVSHYAGDRRSASLASSGHLRLWKASTLNCEEPRTRTAHCSSAGASQATPTGGSPSH
jgi:hypothetical protein